MRRFTRLSMLLALSIVLNIVESNFPLLGGQIPGLKLGLANIVTLFILYKFSFKDAMYVGILRVFVVGILRTGIFSTTFILSLSGVIASIIIMYLVKKIFSIVGVSISGSLTHSIMQLVVAYFLLRTNMFIYLPVFIIFSIITGVITGLACKHLLNHFEDDLLFLEE